MKKITLLLIALTATISLNAQNPFVNGMVFDVDAIVCAGDSTGNCDPANSDIPFTSQASISLGENANEIILSDITGGLYEQGYGDTGNPVTVVVDSDNQTLTVTDQPDVVYGGDTFSATGSYTTDGAGDVDTFTLTWSNTFGDAGTNDYTFNSIVNSVPGAVSNPTPADGATDVVITTTDNNETAVDFAFDAPTTGDAPANYLITISNDPTFPENTEMEINTISGNFPATTTNFEGLLLPDEQYFQTGTTYYWMVAPSNGAGSTPEEDVVTWSFTTEGELNVEDFNKDFSLTNFVKDGVLTINTTSTLENVTVFNILGNKIVSQKLNGNKNAQINISHLQTGVYLAQVELQGQVKTFKFIKK